MIKYEFKKSNDLQSALQQLWTILVHLRSPEGCPWDRAETLPSSCINLKNEIYELLDEVKKGSNDGIKEELGDIAINAIMMLKIASDDHNTDAIGVIDAASEKLLFRHPHVFGALHADDPVEALNIWNEQKKKEGKKPGADFFERIPKSKGVFERTIEVNTRAKKAGFDWNSSDEIFAKHDEEYKEVKHALKSEPRENLEMELGDLMFTCISLADNLGFDPEECLRRAITKFEKRFNDVYHLAKERGVEMKKENNAVLNEFWDEVKKNR